MHLLPILQATQPPDELGSPILLFLFLIAAAIAIVATVLSIGVISGTLLALVGALAIAFIVVACIAVAAACVHITLAAIVWTRRPPRRAWLTTRAWGWLTLFAGVFAVLPFWWLHYGRAARTTWGSSAPPSETIPREACLGPRHGLVHATHVDALALTALGVEDEQHRITRAGGLDRKRTGPQAPSDRIAEPNAEQSARGRAGA
jgi:hypothetical protein